MGLLSKLAEKCLGTALCTTRPPTRQEPPLDKSEIDNGKDRFSKEQVLAFQAGETTSRRNRWTTIK